MSKKRTMSKRHWLLVAASCIVVAVFLLVMLTGRELSSKPKIGFIMTGSVTDDGWNGQHYSGIVSACNTLGAELLVEENIAEGTGQCAEAIHRLADAGAEMIVLSSYSYPSEVKEVIDRYPDIAFYGISAEYNSDNMTSYFGRMYQARYLAGIVAAMQSESGMLGYVAAMPNAEVNRGINAFMLGARSVDPDAQVNVIFTDAWDNEVAETAAANRLINEYKCDVLTYHQNRHNVAVAADAAGVYSIGYNAVAEGLSERYLTAAVWDWGALYYQIVREYVQGNANMVQRRWLGMETGVIGLSQLSSLVSDESRAALADTQSKMYTGVSVFSGEIYDNEGVLRCSENEVLSDDMLFRAMDWYVDGVVIYG